MKTPEEFMTAIRSKIGDRKALASNSIEHAMAINKNRSERAALSLEIKSFVKEWVAAKKAATKAAKPVKKAKKEVPHAEQTVLA